MPFKSDKLKIDNTKLDRRVKLQPEQKLEIIKLHSNGMTIRAITRLYKVNRRLIQFIIFPERLKKNIQNYRDRGGWEAYYNKKKRREYMKKHRDYKNKLYKNGDIISKDDVYIKENLQILINIVNDNKLSVYKIHKKYKDIISYNAIRNYLYNNDKIMPWINIFKPFMERFKEDYNYGSKR
jgi:hypothetical protein